MTIVGFEKQKNDEVHILVFDPTSRDTKTILQLLDKTFHHKASAADQELHPYRRGARHLRKHGEFEVL